MYVCSFPCSAGTRKNQSGQCQKKEGANPRQQFLAFGPHQHDAAQSLPGTAGLKYMYSLYICLVSLHFENLPFAPMAFHVPHFLVCDHE